MGGRSLIVLQPTVATPCHNPNGSLPSQRNSRAEDIKSPLFRGKTGGAPKLEHDPIGGGVIPNVANLNIEVSQLKPSRISHHQTHGLISPQPCQRGDGKGWGGSLSVRSSRCRICGERETSDGSKRYQRKAEEKGGNINVHASSSAGPVMMFRKTEPNSFLLMPRGW
jgi:hypothetical protein